MDSSARTTKSPFVILPEDLAAVCASPGFDILRNYLAANAANAFCDEHQQCDDEDRATWLLHRDLLHALVMPIVKLYNRASVLAKAALCTQKPEDLEIAFRGDARGAFLWLQCFLGDEEDWCCTRGCPACITSLVLSTESTIRMTTTAALLSGNPTPVTSPSGASLPGMSFMLPVLRSAVEADPFWGSHYWAHHFSRSDQLRTGIEALISQCSELEVLVTSPTIGQPRSAVSATGARTVSSPLALRPGSNRMAGLGEEDGDDNEQSPTSLRLQKSRLAKRQLRLQREEQELLQRLVWQCWSAVALPSELRNAIRAGTKNSPGQKRRRSLTCP